MKFALTRRSVVSASLALTLSFGGVMGAAQVALAASTTTDASSDTASATATDTRTVVDSDGNEVVIPVEVTRVAPAIGAFAQVTEMLTHGGTKVVATATNNVSDTFKEVFPGYAEGNPENYDSGSVENLIAAQCQVVYGPSSIFSDEQVAQLDEAGIAFVSLNKIGSVDGMCESILTIGQILGDDEYATAQQFVEYYRGGIEASTEATKDIADDEKPRVMQLNSSADQYTTTNENDISNEYFTAAGAINVTDGYSSEGNGMSMSVSPEQIIEWDPQYIFCMNADTAELVKADEALAGVSAVVDGNVYVVPTGVYLWSVRSGEGALMTPWLDSILHADLFEDLDMVQEVQDFFSDYYGYELADEDAQAIVAGETAM